MSTKIKLPESFVESTKALLKDEYPAFEKALSDVPPISIRINDKHSLVYDSEDKVPWCDSGYYLNERPSFTADPLFHAGAYYVQEASSMFIAHIAKSIFPDAETVLDLCAAPGGKSTLLAQVLSDNTLLVSNEIITSRAHILAENMIKWGNPNVVVTNNTPQVLGKLSSFFDVMLVDAPCSGEGMFRKDPKAIQEWCVQNVKMSAKRQKDILQDSWNGLKDNGILVYSTCTFNRQENEENIAWLIEHLGAELVQLNISKFDGIVKTDYGYRFYPHRVKGEGFFVSVLRKLPSKSSRSLVKLRIKNNYKNASSSYQHQLKNPEAFIIQEFNGEVIAFPKHNHLLYKYLKEQLNCMLNALTLAEIKGKNYIPTHQLALSKAVNTEEFSSFELDYETAIAYLRRENIFLKGGFPDKYILLSYKTLSLGWVRNLGTRFNNMYPQHWRIRKQIV